MQTTTREEAAKQQQEFEQARKNNVETFLRMFLSLGSDAEKLAGARHDQ
jgi:hypothetical protein